MNIVVRCICLLSGLMLSFAVSAESIRCDGHIIDEGMNQDEVLEYCGPPDEKSHETHNIWIYKSPDNRLDRHIYFYANGDILRIDTVQN